MRRPSALLAVGAPLAVGLVVVLAGCAGDDPRGPDAEPHRAAGRREDRLRHRQDRAARPDQPGRAAARERRDAAKGAGVISTTEPKFQGTITGTIKGLAGTIDVVAIGADTYLKFFTPDYKKTDFDTLNAPNPAMFFDPATGISALLPQTANPKDDGQTRLRHRGARQGQRHPARLEHRGPVPPRRRHRHLSP